MLSTLTSCLSRATMPALTFLMLNGHTTRNQVNLASAACNHVKPVRAHLGDIKSRARMLDRALPRADWLPLRLSMFGSRPRSVRAPDFDMSNNSNLSSNGSPN